VHAFRQAPPLHVLRRRATVPNQQLDAALPAARLQEFHDRLKAEQDILESYDTEESVAYIQVGLLVVLLSACFVILLYVCAQHTNVMASAVLLLQPLRCCTPRCGVA
jgi:hypothetical protein